LVVFLLFSGACGDRAVSPTPEARIDVLVASVAADGLKDLPALRIGHPSELRSWVKSDEALVRAIAEGDNMAVIGIKDPSQPSVYETGIRAAVSTGAIGEALTALQRMGVELIRFHPSIGNVTVTIDPLLAPAVRRHPAVDYMEPRISGELATLGTRLVSSTQEIPWGIELVRAPQAWMSTTGAGASLKIMDTGYDRGHEDLPVIPLENCSGIIIPCEDSQAELWHGTHVLGIAAALDNTHGVIGVAPGMYEWDVYVSDVCEDGFCDSVYIVEALDQAAGWGIDVVNMSFAIGPSADIADAIARAWAADVVLVAAAGNTGDPDYPAKYANVIGVSGVEEDMSFASGSKYGSYVDLAAPFRAYSTVGYDSYYEKKGTSQAAPHVAGVAVLVRSQYPSWTNQQVVDQLFSTANDQGPPGKDPKYGYGVVDAERAAMGVH
jgi:subtilisin family serine protease